MESDNKSLIDSAKHPEINKIDGQFKWIEDKELYYKKDMQAHKKLVLEVIDDWKNVDINWLESTDFTSGGGSYTYKIWIDTKNIPEEKIPIIKNINHKTIILHSRVLQENDPFIEDKMRKSHKLLYKYDLITPRLYEGKDWWIEPCIQNDNDHVLSIEEYAVLMAKLHCLPTDWHDEFYEKYIKEWPELKDAHPHGHIWTFVAKSFGYLQKRKYADIFINAGKHYEPRTEAGKRIVNVHSDFFNSNILYDKDVGKAYIIDLEYLSVGWAARDLAFIFFWIDSPGKWGIFKDIRPNKKMSKYEAKFLFVETYQKYLNLPCEKCDIEDLIFDAECAKLRHFHCVLNDDLKFKQIFDESYECDMYKEHERMEILARNDENLKKEVIEKGILTVIEKQSPNLPTIKANKNEILKKDQYFKDMRKNMHEKRKFQTSDQEKEFLQKIYELKGVVLVDIDKCYSYQEAVDFLAEKGLILLEKEDFIELEIFSGSFSFWTYYNRTDKKKDIIQIGFKDSPDNKEKAYKTYKELYKNFPKDIEDNKFCSLHPICYLYAKYDKKPDDHSYLNITKDHEKNWYKSLFSFTQSEQKRRIKQDISEQDLFKIDENAKENHGIIKLETEYCLNYDEAKNLALNNSCRLPYKEELKSAGLNLGTWSSYWSYVK